MPPPLSLSQYLPTICNQPNVFSYLATFGHSVDLIPLAKHLSTGS